MQRLLTRSNVESLGYLFRNVPRFSRNCGAEGRVKYITAANKQRASRYRGDPQIPRYLRTPCGQSVRVASRRVPMQNVLTFLLNWLIRLGTVLLSRLLLSFCPLCLSDIFFQSFSFAFSFLQLAFFLFAKNKKKQSKKKNKFRDCRVGKLRKRNVRLTSHTTGKRAG